MQCARISVVERIQKKIVCARISILRDYKKFLEISISWGKHKKMEISISWKKYKNFLEISVFGWL